MHSVESKLVFVFIAFFLCLSGNAQVIGLELDPEKERMFKPYLTYRHQGPEGLEQFKREHPHEYLKELWYYGSSFTVKRDHFSVGDPLDESTIDISRFENFRKEDESAIVVLDGYKDVLILLPANQLLFKP